MKLNPIHLRMLCAEIGPVVLEKKIFKFRQCFFSLFRNYLPLEKGMALNLKKLESTLPKNALCQVWWKLAQWWGEEDENVKSLQTDGRQVIRKAHLSFQLR